MNQAEIFGKCVQYIDKKFQLDCINIFEVIKKIERRGAKMPYPS